MKRVARLALLLAIGYAVIAALALLFENSLVYPASSAAASWAPPPDPAIQDVELASADGTKLHGWFLPHDGEGAILVSHGNGGNLSHRGSLMVELQKVFHRPVLIYDYPGYGKSEESPSEAGCYAAGEAAYRWLVKTKMVPANRILLYGESLGGGVTVELGIRHESEGLLLVSTFTTLPQAAKSRFFFLPCEWLMRNRFESIAKLPNYLKPVFISHGDADATIPFSQGERLFAAANEPKRFRKVEGGTHSGAADAAILREAAAFFAQARGQ